jgi:signal transduction histidine kinase
VAHLFALRQRDDRADLDSIAHDLNNLLTAISGYASLLTTNEDATQEMRRDAGEIADASTRAAQLVRQLRHPA